MVEQVNQPGCAYEEYRHLHAWEGSGEKTPDERFYIPNSRPGADLFHSPMIFSSIYQTVDLSLAALSNSPFLSPSNTYFTKILTQNAHTPSGTWRS